MVQPKINTTSITKKTDLAMYFKKFVIAISYVVSKEQITPYFLSESI
jgi:hypothetical protein